MSTRAELSGFRLVEDDLPELRAVPTFSIAWYRLRRELHLARFPDTDQATRDNLDMLVEMAEARAGRQS